MDQDNFLPFSDFYDEGVLISDTFESWRKKTNGVINEVEGHNLSLSQLYVSGSPRFVTIDTIQEITGNKLFSAGTASDNKLKIGDAGFYYENSALNISKPVKTEKLINSGASIQLGNYTYNIPTSNPTSSKTILTKSGSNLIWKNESELLDSVADTIKNNNTFVTTSEILPVGTIITHSSTVAPAGWLTCDGDRFKGSDYPELAREIKNTFGAVYSSDIGLTVVPNGDKGNTSYLVNLNHYFTLPNLNGRVIVGSGSGFDGIDNRLFTLGEYDGMYTHQLVIDELPSHSHTITTPNANITVSEAGLHSHKINPPVTTTTENGVHEHRIAPPRAVSDRGGEHTHAISSYDINTRLSGIHNHNVSTPRTNITTSIAGAHVHSIAPPDANISMTSAGIHSHKINPPATPTTSDGIHKHSINPPQTTSSDNGGHSHKINPPSTTSSSDGIHAHSINPPITTSSDNGGHTHKINPPSTTSSSDGIHKHSINPPATNTGSSGIHKHSINPPATNTGSSGSHSHEYKDRYFVEVYDVDNNRPEVKQEYRGERAAGAKPWNRLGSNGGLDWDNPYFYYIEKNTSDAGAHTHTINIAAFDSADAGDHTHTVDIAAFDSADAGAHTHTVDIAEFDSSAVANHTHTVDIAAFDSANAGAHTHTVDIVEFDSASAGAHTHTVDIAAFDSADAGAHTHTVDIVEFDSASAGAHTHTVKIDPFNSASSGAHSHTIAISDFDSDDAGEHSHEINIPEHITNINGVHTHTVDITPFNSNSSGSHTHTLDIAEFDSSNSGIHSHTIVISPFASSSTGGNARHNITQPYMVGNYIIKAIPDVVINTKIKRGNAFDFIKNNISETSISLVDGGEFTINLLHDTTLKIDNDRKLGVSNDSIGSTQIINGSITQSKLSTGAPSWDTNSSLYEGVGATRKRIATREYVDNKIFKVGSVLKLAERNSGSKNTCVSATNNFSYINTLNQCVACGENTEYRYSYSDMHSHTMMSLPHNKKAAKLYANAQSTVVLDTDGQLWVMGSNRYNQFNISNWDSTREYLKEWTLAYDSLYAYSTGNKVKQFIIPDTSTETTTYVIDSNNRLWSAGYNTYGALGNGTTVHTSEKTNRRESSPVLPKLNEPTTTVEQVVAVGSFNGATSYATVAAILTNGKIVTAGYGGNGQNGQTGINVKDINSTFTEISLLFPTGVNGNAYDLYGSGNGQYTSFYIVRNTGTEIYAWGYNGDGRFGIGLTADVQLPIKIWDSADAGKSPVKKFYTTSHANTPTNQVGANYILTTDDKIWATGKNTYNKFGFNTVYNDSIIDFTYVWQRCPDKSGHTVVDFYVGNGYNSNTINMVKYRRDSDGILFLYAAGHNLDYQCGDGTNLRRVEYTQVPLNHEFVEKIVDVQATSNYGGKPYTILQMNDNTIYFAGYNDYGIDPQLPNTKPRPFFTRIRTNE
jgi:microcystin-dependent protein